MEKELAQLTHTVNTALEGLITSIQKAQPDVIHALGTAIVARCLYSIIIGLVTLAALTIGVYVINKHIKHIDSSDKVAATVGAWIVYFAINIPVACATYLNVYNWLGLFDQKAWVATQVINKIFR